MKTTIEKDFDAVAESRKWREKTSALLSKMTSEEKIAFLNRRLTRFRPAPEGKPRTTASS